MVGFLQLIIGGLATSKALGVDFLMDFKSVTLKILIMIHINIHA